jgi:ribonuclease J
MEACKEAKPDVLIIEGTRVDSNSSKKEDEVEDEIFEVSSKAKGRSVGNWSVRDTDRMLSFLNAAKKLGKKLAISLNGRRHVKSTSNVAGVRYFVSV